MFLMKQKTVSTFAVLNPLVLLLTVCLVEVQAQRSGSTAHDQARAIQRAELHRMLIASVPSRSNYASNRAEVMKQARTDFRELQGLNNKMMAAAWERDALDYSLVSEMMSRIRGKANRLKTNLRLPNATDLEITPSILTITSARQFRAELLVLDTTIMRFVNNPLFRTPNTVEVNQAAQAARDLETVISLSADLKKTASRLSKPASSN